MDEDGDEDIVVGNVKARNNVFLNLGNGQKWEKIVLSDKKFSTYDIMVFDLNGDRKLDIIESNSDEQNIYYFNRFTPKFP